MAFNGVDDHPKLVRDFIRAPKTISYRAIGPYLRPEGNIWHIFCGVELTSTVSLEYETKNTSDEQSESIF